MRVAVLDEIREAYHEASGQWTGLDWTALSGPWLLDIEGQDADELRRLAAALREDRWDDTDGTIVDRVPPRCGWDDQDSTRDRDLPIHGTPEEYVEAIAEWLEEAAEYVEAVASDAAEAEECAARAMRAVECRCWGKAEEEIRRACNIEATYGDCPTWSVLRDTIEQAPL